MSPHIEPREVSDLQWERLLRDAESYQDPPGCAGAVWRLMCRLPERAWRVLDHRERLSMWVYRMVWGHDDA